MDMARFTTARRDIFVAHGAREKDEEGVYMEPGGTVDDVPAPQAVSSRQKKGNVVGMGDVPCILTPIRPLLVFTEEAILAPRLQTRGQSTVQEHPRPQRAQGFLVDSDAGDVERCQGAEGEFAGEEDGDFAEDVEWEDRLWAVGWVGCYLDGEDEGLTYGVESSGSWFGDSGSAMSAQVISATT